jgi:hypothetical protein
VNAYDPYTVEAPLEKDISLETGGVQLKMGMGYYSSLDAKADAATVSKLATNINLRLTGILTPEQIETTSGTHPQIKIKSQ